MFVATISPTAALGAAAAGYLLGSLPVAVLVSRRRDLDPREVGDRNPGYWNVRQHLRRSDALVVFAGDLAKGALAGAVGVALDTSSWIVAYLAVAAAMVGHAFPVFAGFRGGRSILAFAGGMMVVAPLAAAIAAAALAVTWLVSRSFVIAARVAVFGVPFAQALVDPKERVAATGLFLCFIGMRFAQAAACDRKLAR